MKTRTKSLALLALLVVTAGAIAGCTKPQLTVMDVCMQYKASRDCDAKLRKRVPTTIKCDALSEKYQPKCTQADIDYAYQAFKQDAEKMCALKTMQELESFKSFFDATKLSAACNQLTK